MSIQQDFLWDAKSLNADVFIVSPEKYNERPQGSKTYASFGDDGTTVSVNQYGNIMQISRYLDFGPSGFLCVDSQYPKPYYVQNRMEDQIKSMTSRTRGLRLDLVDWSTIQHEPVLGFKYDRWPRYIFNSKISEDPITTETNDKDAMKDSTFAAITCPLSIQYFCHEGAVVQKYFIRLGDGGVSHKTLKPKLSLASAICIRGLDFVEDHDFDESIDPKDLESFIVSDYNLFITRSLSEDDLDVSKTAQPTKVDLRRPAAGALVISSFINGKPAKIGADKCICLVTSSTELLLEITVVYVLETLSRGAMEFLRSLRDTQPGRSWDGVTCPITQSVDVPRPWIKRTLSADRLAAMPEQEAVSERPSTLTARGITALEEYEPTSDLIRVIETAIKEMRQIFCATSPFRRIFFAPNPHIDFTFRRNLEHILSVCSIGISSEQEASPFTGPAIAITCGDISGHRIGPRASLSAVQFLCSVLTYLSPFDRNARQRRFKNQRAHLELGADASCHVNLVGLPSTQDDLLSEDQWLARAHEQAGPEFLHLFQLFNRVQRVLQGHLLWVCSKAGSWKDGSFAPHYWPTGKRIDNLDYLSPASLVDTPIQLLKIFHCLQADFVKQSKREYIRERLQSKLEHWLKDVHTLNRWGAYAFPRKLKSNSAHDRGHLVSKYNLADHVMIGLAFRCIEKLERSDPPFLSDP